MWLPRNPRFPRGAWKRPWLSSSYTEQKSLANSLNQSCRNGNQQLPESHCSLSAPNIPRWVLFADIGIDDPSTWNILPPSLHMTDSLSPFSWDFISIEQSFPIGVPLIILVFSFGNMASLGHLCIYCLPHTLTHSQLSPLKTEPLSILFIVITPMSGTMPGTK